MGATVRFWGVRGSIAAPLTAADVRAKKKETLIRAYEMFRRGTFEPRDPEEFAEVILQREYREHGGYGDAHTYGGNTSCVEIRSGGKIYILDMGTGARPLGNSLFSEMFANGGLAAKIFFSHVHWDHIQGLPFFGPLYVNSRKVGIKNSWQFYGGTTWQKTAEACLRGQMDPPVFPVSLKELERINEGGISFEDVCDGMVLEDPGAATIEFGKLHHPQETYGARFTFPDGKVVTYATDWEPYAVPSNPDPSLLRLAKGADVLISDCQYSLHQYTGQEGGVARFGWGHSFPEAVAEVAARAGVKTVVLFHHDPGSSDGRIGAMARTVQRVLGDDGARVTAAWEGLTIEP